MSVKNSHELKQLQTRRAKLEVELAVANQELRETQSKFNKIQDQLRRVEKSIDDMRESDVILTEHAILRYLERQQYVNLAEIREEILTEKVVEQIKTLRTGKFPLENGCKAVVKNMSIVSII